MSARMEYFRKRNRQRPVSRGRLPQSKKPVDWRRHYTVSEALSMFGGVLVRHLLVARRSGKDGIGWDVLQRIKNDVLGPDALAIEVFPPAGDLVNQVNMRHLWEVPEELISRMPSLMRR